MKRAFALGSIALAILVLFPVAAAAQPVRTLVSVIVAPTHADWMYKAGEPVKFDVSILRWNNPLKGVSIQYEVGPEKMDAVKTGELVLADGRTTIDGGTMKAPGFLQCRVKTTVDGKEYSGFGTAGFDPLAIQPTTDVPADFDAFWQKNLAESAAVPLEPKLTPLPDRSTETVDVYQVKLRHSFRENSYIYGILCLPKGAEKRPALLRVPGAGVRGYAGDVAMAKKGIITLDIGVNGIPVTMDPSVYWDLYYGGLSEYWFYNLDDRDNYYYKRVYLACVRAADFLCGLPQFDGTNLAVAGGSQGGALSIVTAALHPRIKGLAPVFPALCDLTGYLHGRAGGWPHMFDKAHAAFNAKPDKIAVSKYYDVVNFARRVKVPGLYSWGFNDVTCPPTSMYAAYNVVTAPKKLLLLQDTGHWNYPEQTEALNAWLLEFLTGAAKGETK